MQNLCEQYLQETNTDLDKYWCYCDDLADEVVKWAKGKGIDAREVMISDEDTFIQAKGLPIQWDYHVVVEVDGMIHDAWFDEVLPRKEYLYKNFGTTDLTCDFVYEETNG